MQALKYVAVGVLLGLAAAAAVLIISAPPRGIPIQLLPSPTPAPLTIYVSGAVAKPGLYTLSPGSRVSDALTAAGGALDSADLASLNLAQRLIDGQKIQVSLAVETMEGEMPERDVAIDPDLFPLDLNSATQEQLEQLPGIGPAKASDIIACRQKLGGFDKIEQIMEVPGIGPATFEKIKEFIMVAPRN